MRTSIQTNVAKTALQVHLVLYIAHDKRIAFEPLVKLLEDPVAEVRIAALNALIAAAPPQVQDAAVKRLLKDPDESVRNAAAENAKFLQQRRDGEDSTS